MREGILEALDAVQQATGERAIHALGYCVGGTLLAATLAYLAATRDSRVKSATFLTTQVDFSQAGDLKVFMDEEQVAAIERDMARHGYLDGHKMAAAFNLLRSNDLIWPYVVDVYMKGKTPLPLDLLYWNSDSTRIPAANHSFYLRRCYINNDLSQRRIQIGGVTLDLSKVRIPIYHLAAREDHIAPARSVFLGRTVPWWFRPVCRCRLGPYRRGCEPAGTEPVSVLDRRAACGRTRDLARSRGGASGLLVAGLAGLERGAGQEAGSGPGDRRGQAHPHRGCAGQLCSGEELSTEAPAVATHRSASSFRRLSARRDCHELPSSSRPACPSGVVQEPQMGDAIGPNAREQAKPRPEQIVGPTQPLHHRVGVDHTPARLAERQLLRARQTPFELGPEPAQRQIQPRLSDHLGTVVVVGELGRATALHLCQVSRQVERPARARDTSRDLRPPRRSGHADHPRMEVQPASVTEALTRRLRGWGGNRVRRSFDDRWEIDIHPAGAGRYQAARTASTGRTRG